MLGRTSKDLVDSAPEIELPESAFYQTVGWSSQRGAPVSLRDYLAVRGPDYLRAELGITEPEVEQPIKRVTDLSPEELEETVEAQLREGTQGLGLAVVGEGDFTTNELIDQVRRRTALGVGLMEAIVRNIDLLERLGEAGKIRGIASPVPHVELPDFDF